jgi:hypothetical protein
MGGHHFANMLSTDKQFANRINEKSYSQLQINAHVNDDNLGQLHPHMISHIEKNIEKYKSQSNILNSHIGAFCMFKSSGLIDNFPNRKYYLIEFPKNPKLDMFFRKRAWKHRDMAYYNYGYYYHEFKNHHKHEIVSSIVGDYVLPIPSDIIFTQDPQEYITLANANLDLNLQYDIIKPLHEHWYNTVINSVFDAPEPPDFNDIITGKN